MTAPPGSLMPPILNPSSLYSEEARRDATRIRIYNSVLQQIYNKVKAISRVPGNEKCLWYVVPEFIPGTPRFDVRDCIVYLVWNMRNAGYQVDYTHPNLMLVSWRNHDDKYKEQESPWAQVLGAARDQVLQTTQIPTRAPKTTATATVRPIPSMMPLPSTLIPNQINVQESEYKRKTILKKTAEYRPISAQPDIRPQRDAALTGTLSAKHISFV